MILLDTNVISEPLRPLPEARVSDWIDAQPSETLYLSAMTVAELRAGVAVMPTGKRRTALHENLEKRVLPMFGAHFAFRPGLHKRLCRTDSEGSQGRLRHRDCRRLHRSSRFGQRISRCHTRHKPFPGCRPGRHQPLG